MKPPPLGRSSFKYPDDLAKVTPEHEAACREMIEKEEGWRRHKGPYTPPSLEGSLVLPSIGGGAEWTGGTFDPAVGYYIINTADSGQISLLQSMDVDPETLPPHRRFYGHGPDRSGRKGTPESPLLYGHPGGPPVSVNGWPCWQPPWSRLTAVNVNTGEIAWQIPFGTVEGAPAGMKTGAPSSQTGGPTSTAGGVTFIGGASDRMFRAYETKTGKELWSVKTAQLIRANPITYLGKDGKQYVAVAAGTTLLTYRLP